MSDPGSPRADAFSLRTIGPEPEGATPLDEEDLADLIPEFVATRGDLNIVEFDNITKAMPWALDQARRGGPYRVLDFSFLFGLHDRMFEDVWKWAGTQRRGGTNIGVDRHRSQSRRSRPSMTPCSGTTTASTASTSGPRGSIDD